MRLDHLLSREFASQARDAIPGRSEVSQVQVCQEKVAEAAVMVLVSTLQGLGSHDLSAASYAARVDAQERSRSLPPQHVDN